LIRKIGRQLPASSSQPPRKGAIAADPAESSPCPDRVRAVAGLEGRLDDRQAGRCHQRASDTLHGPRGDVPADAGHSRAQH
jgi:hypothetical protein